MKLKPLKHEIEYTCAGMIPVHYLTGELLRYSDYNNITRDEIIKIIEPLQNEIQQSKLFGKLNTFVCSEKVSHEIVSLWYGSDSIFGKFKILNTEKCAELLKRIQDGEEIISKPETCESWNDCTKKWELWKIKTFNLVSKKIEKEEPNILEMFKNILGIDFSTPPPKKEKCNGGMEQIIDDLKKENQDLKETVSHLHERREYWYEEYCKLLKENKSLESRITLLHETSENWCEKYLKFLKDDKSTITGTGIYFKISEKLKNLTKGEFYIVNCMFKHTLCRFVDYSIHNEFPIFEKIDVENIATSEITWLDSIETVRPITTRSGDAWLC